jgi:hypothetical protein
MAERRSLVAGLKPPSPEQQQAEKSFVYGDDRNDNARPAIPQPKAVETATAANEEGPENDTGILPQLSNRVPLTTRTKPEVASALKRASLTRQLKGKTPYTMQDIHEEALENWLRDNGYLS